MRNLIIVFLLLTTSMSSALGYENNDIMNEKKTFVLIHGSWHSAWNWFRVTPLLEKQGHRVIAPDLPGMGRDKTPVKEVRFEKTVQKICDLIDTVPGKVILVGHSKNGVLISQIAEYRPEKIEKLVYLAAVLVPNGKSALDLFKLDKEEVLGPYITYHPKSNSSTLSPEIYKKGLYHDCDDEITEMAKIILSHEPRQTATTKISITDKNYGSVPRYYIECTEDRAITPVLQQKMYRDMPCKEVYKIATSHSPFFSKPQELVDILLKIAYKG
ncbi:alpha/beta fold hydrolase [Galbibacter sp. EGI 63066]|uniref:alpha/beta fold hydrolase n=1 Tax=Galbibacter sp. EGI 63066 TaxID=2993559 RepID=UPI0022497748|nr:alpha/beta fold hydrolase [Galbibacter sp. EGI 63066]MCX2681829.1 alpha/beta fold hydrolase [Galbibacter sp. EGI 63066]